MSVETLLAAAGDWAVNVASRYGVHPRTYLIVSACCTPFFYYLLYRLSRLLKSMKRRRTGSVAPWASMFLASALAPYAYIALFGHRLPWWMWLVLGMGGSAAVVSLARRVIGGRPHRVVGAGARQVSAREVSALRPRFVT